MATTIGALNVILSASTGPLMKGLSSARAMFGGFSKAVTSTQGILAGLGMGVSVAGITALTKSSMDAIDESAKLSDQLGVSTEKLGGLQLAADLSGVGVEGLATNMTKMARTIGEAATGSSTAQAALKAVGTSAEELVNKSPDQQLAIIAEGLNKIESPSVRASAAMDIFGKSGMGMVSMLAGGAKGLEEAQQKADAYGLSLSRVDAAKVEAANDSITELKSVFTGLGNSLAVGLAPYITAATTYLKDFIVSSGGMSSIVEPAIEFVAKGIGILADGINYGKIGFMALQTAGVYALEGIVKGVGYLIQGIGWVIDGLGGWLKILNVLPEWLGGTQASNIAEGMIELSDGIKDFGKTIVDSLDGTGEEVEQKLAAAFAKEPPSTGINSAFAKIKLDSQAAAEAVAAANQKSGNSFAVVDSAAEKNADSIKKIIDGLKEQTDTVGMTAEQIDLYKLKMAGASDTTIEAATAMQKFITSQKTLNDLRKEAATAGMTSEQKQIYDLQQSGADAATIGEAKKLQDEIAMKKKWAEQDSRLARSSEKSPMARYESEIGMLNDRLKAGNITWDQYKDKVKSAREELEKAGKTGKAGQFAYAKDVLRPVSSGRRETAIASAVKPYTSQGQMAQSRFVDMPRPGDATSKAAPVGTPTTPAGTPDMTLTKILAVLQRIADNGGGLN